MQPPHPPARTGPRPLPLHLALEAWISQLSFSGLLNSNAVSRRLNPLPPLPPDLPDLLQKARAESPNQTDQSQGPEDLLDPFRMVDALSAASKQRLEAFADGVSRYHVHPARRQMPETPVLWRKGAAALHDFGGTGAPVLVVPSLINRSTILDLAPDRSMLRSMAAANLRTLLLDWGLPGPDERFYTITDYVSGVLLPAVEKVIALTGRPPRLMGYCMGGTLTVAAAVLAPQRISGLAIVATPWDFHVDTAGIRALLTNARMLIESMITVYGEAPFDLLQALFAILDPTLVGRKFRRFAGVEQASDDAARFVILEDWLNDPVPLVAAVARECLFAWYGDNTPARGQWRVSGRIIDPAHVACPTLAVIPSRDRIVPPASAMALAQALPNALIRTNPLGHIGMMASSRAASVTYDPLIAWLRSPTTA